MSHVVKRLAAAFVTRLSPVLVVGGWPKRGYASTSIVPPPLTTLTIIFPKRGQRNPMRPTTASLSVRALFASISLIFLLAMPSALRAQAPDLTTTDLTTINRAWTWNLGATGMRGWIYNAWPATMNTDDCTLFAPYQILVTTVAPNTPADGVLAIDDVILGASAGAGAVPLFTTDARKTLGWAIGAAEAADGILSLKRWRAGVTTDVSITLPVMGGLHGHCALQLRQVHVDHGQRRQKSRPKNQHERVGQ